MSWLEALTQHAASALDDRAREALYARGVTDEQIELYRIGYIDRTLPDELKASDDFLKWSHQGSKLDDAFLLPLTNTLGNVRGFQFRHVDKDRAGYMDFIEGKDEAVLFGLAQAIPHIWRTRSVFLVEGAFDLFPIQRHVPQVVATLTARVVDALVRVLRRLVRRIWLGYDMDETGRRGSDRFIKAHGDEFEDVSIIEYPKIPMISGKLIKDPGDLWETWGDTQFGAFLLKATAPDPQLESYAEALSPR